MVAFALNAIDPAMADDVVSGDGDAHDQSIKEEQQAIAAITSGLDVDIPPNEYNQTKAQYYMQWFQRPDVQQRLQQDKIIAAPRNRGLHTISRQRTKIINMPRR